MEENEFSKKIIEHKSKNVFDVPEGYFEHSKSNIFSQIKINSRSDSKNIFEVPTNYFNQNKFIMLTRIKPKNILLRKTLYFGIAATIIFSIGLGINIFLKKDINYETAQIIDKIPMKDIENEFDLLNIEPIKVEEKSATNKKAESVIISLETIGDKIAKIENTNTDEEWKEIIESYENEISELLTNESI